MHSYPNKKSDSSYLQTFITPDLVAEYKVSLSFERTTQVTASRLFFVRHVWILFKSTPVIVSAMLRCNLPVCSNKSSFKRLDM